MLHGIDSDLVCPGMLTTANAFNAMTCIGRRDAAGPLGEAQSARLASLSLNLTLP